MELCDFIQSIINWHVRYSLDFFNDKSLFFTQYHLLEAYEDGVIVKFLIALLLWLAVFIPSAIISSLAYQKKKNAGVAMQLSLLVLSLPLAIYLKTLIVTPLKIEIVFFGLVGFLYSLFLNAIIKKVKLPEKVLPRGLLDKFLILLLLAPLAEELLNRGLVAGYLLKSGYILGAILFSAVLFALPHIMAFKKGKFVVVTGSFILGLLLGYAYYTTGIVGAFVTHSCANLAGLVKYFKSRKKSDSKQSL